MAKTKLLTLTECAAMLGVSTRTVATWIKAGRMVGVYTGAQRKRARYVTEEETESMARKLRKGV